MASVPLSLAKDEVSKGSKPTQVVEYGPFHRIQSTTQSSDVARLQQQSNEIWGRARRGSDIPQVQAYVGSLPDDEKGIEFMTDVPPDRGSAHARWTGPRVGVTIEDDYCKIKCRITKNTQIPIY